MADTTWIKKVLEPHMRTWLAGRFPGRTFSEKTLPLVGGGRHAFDGVADDDSVVALFLTGEAKTRGGREHTGGVRKAKTDAEVLVRAAGRHRLMVFTNAGFRNLAERRIKAKGGGTGIEFIVCDLPDELVAGLKAVRDDSSGEQRSRIDP